MQALLLQWRTSGNGLRRLKYYPSSEPSIVMTKHHLTLNEEHCRAICLEIGERLRFAMGENLPMPRNLSRLMDRLKELDQTDSPSIVPSIENGSRFLGSAPAPML
jgi:hypothetical protein